MNIALRAETPTTRNRRTARDDEEISARRRISTQESCLAGEGKQAVAKIGQRIEAHPEVRSSTVDNQ